MFTRGRRALADGAKATSTSTTRASIRITCTASNRERRKSHPPLCFGGFPHNSKAAARLGVAGLRARIGRQRRACAWCFAIGEKPRGFLSPLSTFLWVMTGLSGEPSYGH
ncbi:hypothetical protein DAI22_01g439101 [Oryza sativa Japonica Group]|nr:hypothetical protein DAI22_01g439101 [Oryza sativa Japonica Group]